MKNILKKYVLTKSEKRAFLKPSVADKDLKPVLPPCLQTTTDAAQQYTCTQLMFWQGMLRSWF